MSPETATVAEVLSSPWKIDGLTIKNRYVLSPMAVLQPTKDGHPSDQTIAFLTTRARGGAGLLIIGGSRCHRAREPGGTVPALDAL